jgi:hypothetical protein
VCCILIVSGGDELADKFNKMEKVTKSITYMETVFDALLEKDSVDLETDFTAYSAILGLDKNFVGTSHYMGLFPFWHHEYKFDLRDASPKARQAVHRTLLLSGKKLSGKSAAIKKIIETVLATF